MQGSIQNVRVSQPDGLHVSVLKSRPQWRPKAYRSHIQDGRNVDSKVSSGSGDGERSVWTRRVVGSSHWFSAWWIAPQRDVQRFERGGVQRGAIDYNPASDVESRRGRNHEVFDI